MLAITDRTTQNELLTLLRENNVLSTITQSLNTIDKSKQIDGEFKTWNQLIQIADKNMEFLIQTF